MGDGLLAEARALVDRLQVLHPDVRISGLWRYPFRDAGVWERFTEGLSTAGLPA
jgi:hypothetical protein